MAHKMGIFRALDVRIQQAEFASSFRQFDSVFIANLTSQVHKFLDQTNTTYYDIALKAKFVVDPVYPLLRKTDFTPWLQFDPDVLQEAVKDIQIYEIYEPYFFYSSQITHLARKRGVPLVTEIWTSFSGHPTHYVPPYNFLVHDVVKKTDLFILRSHKAQSYLKAFNIPQHKQKVIYQGVNLSRFTAQKKPHEKLRILFVGELAVHKGLDDLLAVFPDLASAYPGKLELVICGEGPLIHQVNKMSKQLPISFQGYVPNTSLPEIYQSADIYCQPSKDFRFLGIKGGEEFAGYTFMEAMASGLPVVSTYCGGIPEIVGQDNCLVTQGDRSELHRRLDAYISDEALRAETSMKNRKRAEDFFDLHKQTKLLEEIIKDKLM